MPKSRKNSNLLANFLNKFKKPRVAVIQLTGVIAPPLGGMRSQGLYLEALRAEIDKAFALKRLGLVVLAINSPGGSPVQSELIYRYIRHKATQGKVEVLSAVEDLAASGGYMLACAGEKILAADSSIVGSIGVISAGFGFVEAMEKLGIERRVYTSGANKSVLDPFSPKRQQDVDLLLDVQHDAHDSFIALVQTSRGARLPAAIANTDELFSGKFWSGRKALTLGLVDQIGTLDNYLDARFGSKCEIKRFGSKKGWFKRKFGALAGELLSGLEERAISQRYGL